MRLFLTICTLAAVAYAKPQGYNYATGVSGSLGTAGIGGGFLSAPSNTHQHSVSAFGLGNGAGAGGSSFAFGGLGGLGSSGHASGQQTGISSLGSIGFGGLSTGGFNSGFGSSSGSGSFSSTGNYQQQSQQQQQQGLGAPIVHKQFITVSAPEDHENLQRSKHLVIGRPQKNYRVVFIKAPSSSSANVKLSAEYAPQEEKTVIYVLSKKDSALEINDIATPAPTVPSKPEVFFIKYKTEAEAQHAQSQIQAEYDRIEGTSEHTDSGVAPQQSVVGILDGAGGSSSLGGISTGATGSGTYQGAGSNVISTSIGSSSGSGISHSEAQSPTYLPPGGQ